MKLSIGNQSLITVETEISPHLLGSFPQFFTLHWKHVFAGSSPASPTILIDGE